MVTPTLPANVIAGRYVRRVKGKVSDGHLLTRTWNETPGGRRPALCGETAQAWRNVHNLANPDVVVACHRCDVAAGLVPAAPVALAAKPRAKPGRVLDLTAADQATAVLVEPQHARAALPDGYHARRGSSYLPSIPISDRARRPYAPGSDNRTPQ